MWGVTGRATELSWVLGPALGAKAQDKELLRIRKWTLPLKRKVCDDLDKTGWDLGHVKLSTGGRMHLSQSEFEISGEGTVLSLLCPFSNPLQPIPGY